jgi:hypothetical protein
MLAIKIAQLKARAIFIGAALLTKVLNFQTVNA